MNQWRVEIGCCRRGLLPAELRHRRPSSGSLLSRSVPHLRWDPTNPLGAPANKLLETLISGKLPLTLPVGFGCLDVRDFANGAILAAQRRHSGLRYLVSDDNVTTSQLLERPYRWRSCPAIRTATRAAQRHRECLSRSSANSRDNQLL